MRALVLTVTGLLVLGILVSIYKSSLLPNNNIAPLPSNYILIGVIDMDNSQNFSLQNIKNGDDILIVLNNTVFTEQFLPTHPELNATFTKPFDLINYGSTDGEIDNQNPIWSSLFAVTYADNGASYRIKSLNEVGIHAIIARHLTAKGDHDIILTDGDTRILYELKSLSRN